MSQDPVVDTSAALANAEPLRRINASILTALPHYLPLGIFPLLWLALIYGDWWLIAPFIFMGIVNPMDRAIGQDGRFMDLDETTERKLLWHNLPVWAWGCLWPPTLIFGLWQILVGNAYPIWQDVLVAILLTMEAQTVFVVGHELIHRRTTWERRLGEFLLASSSYPQYATEHLYIHHAQVGTPADVGSAPKGVSFWRYFPREVASNLINSWKVIRQKLARQRRSVWPLVLDERYRCCPGIHFPRYVLRVFYETQQLLSTLRLTQSSSTEWSVGESPSTSFMECGLEVNQLDVLQHATTCRSSLDGEQAIPTAANPRNGRITRITGNLWRHDESGTTSEALVRENGSVGRSMAGALLS